ncbi:hypothetical protein FO440_02945 [Mucilaginibacter corticis]|uniref:Toxin-antitoxin system YwqK family antitoxin n=1 Tax=Mucilaginibacter corticis TaxID=2597670 RepID=A0A556MXI0_9SPHI|nr:hypothetical protein [Mucilaginibacter corticis]TSJ44626.1 hypothetical protein FO440_02945 [Mucilaginibacter corticis]
MGLIVTYDDVQQRGTDSGGGIIYYYKGFPLTGMIRETVDGIVVGESEFTDGHIGGVQRLFYSSGQIEEEYTIWFNKLEGTFTEWDKNGNVTSQTYWKNGVQIG